MIPPGMHIKSCQMLYGILRQPTGIELTLAEGEGPTELSPEIQEQFKEMRLIDAFPSINVIIMGKGE